MRKYHKIIFVCTENTARSPMAEAICKGMTGDVEIEVISRGLIVLFPEPSNPKVEIVLINHGLSLEGRTAVPLTKEDIQDDTLMITMTKEEKEKVIRDFECESDVFTLKGFIEGEGDVLDPYGGNLVDYEECYSEISKLIKKLIIKLKRKRCIIVKESKT